MTEPSPRHSRGPLVFLPMQPRGALAERFDPSLLAGYGALRYIYPEHQSLSPSIRAPEAIREMDQRLAEFDPETDYICPFGGDPFAGVVIGLVLMKRQVPGFRLLRYERQVDANGVRSRRGVYVPVWISLEDLLPEDNQGEAEVLSPQRPVLDLTLGDK